MTQLVLDVNGEKRTIQAWGTTTLLQALREQLLLTGAKCGCNYGVCGACTVLINGKPARSCLALAHSCVGAAVTTVESLEQDGQLHPVQQAMLDGGAVQCGFCSAGIALVAKGLLDVNPRPTAQEVRQALGGNICRCSGYAAIVDAVIAAAQVARG
jgi:aerobic-type carbon monoxide dehydrogenase small subunit (CoxS/CutS family)